MFQRNSRMLTRGLLESNEILWLRGGVMMMKAIIFDAFGTLFKVTNGGSAKTIMRNITVWVDRNGIGGNGCPCYR